MCPTADRSFSSGSVLGRSLLLHAGFLLVLHRLPLVLGFVSTPTGFVSVPNRFGFVLVPADSVLGVGRRRFASIPAGVELALAGDASVQLRVSSHRFMGSSGAPRKPLSQVACSMFTSFQNIVPVRFFDQLRPDLCMCKSLCGFVVGRHVVGSERGRLPNRSDQDN